MEFILDFIVEFWLQLIQPKRKGVSQNKRRIIGAIGMALCFLLMCCLLVFFVGSGNIIGICATVLLLVVVVISILLVILKRKHRKDSYKKWDDS